MMLLALALLLACLSMGCVTVIGSDNQVNTRGLHVETATDLSRPAAAGGETERPENTEP